MKNLVVRRQVITDERGTPVAVLLPLEQFAAVRDVLEQRFPSVDDTRSLDDLKESVPALQQADAEWWDPEE